VAIPEALKTAKTGRRRREREYEVGLLDEDDVGTANREVDGGGSVDTASWH